MTYDQAAQQLIHIIGEHEEQELIDIIDKMPINNRYLTSLKPSDKEEALVISQVLYKIIWILLLKK